MVRRWDDTKWKQLSDGRLVNMPKDDEPCVLTVYFRDSRELERDFVFCLGGREISHIEVNGVRYVPAPERKEDFGWMTE